MKYNILSLLFAALATGAMLTSDAEMLFCTFLIISNLYGLAGSLKNDLLSRK